MTDGNSGHILPKRELLNMSNSELLRRFSAITLELRARGVLRTSNNVTSDYGEYVAKKKMRLQLVQNSTEGYDAVDGRNVRYQIKSRRITRFNKSRQLSVIRNIDSRHFQFLVAVIFNEDFSKRDIWKIPIRIVKKHSKFSKHQNGHIFVLDNNVTRERGVVKVSLTKSATGEP